MTLRASRVEMACAVVLPIFIIGTLYYLDSIGHGTTGEEIIEAPQRERPVFQELAHFPERQTRLRRTARLLLTLCKR